MKHLCAIATAAAVALAAPSVALAHLVNSGLGPFYDGALHLLLSPGDLLGLLAAALLAGLRGPTASRLTVTLMALAWLLAGLISLHLSITVDLTWLGVLSVMILGVLVAADPDLPAAAVALLAVLYGLLHGLLNGSALAAVGAGSLALLGIVVTVLTVALLVSAAVVALQSAWTRVVVRVAGSWVAAVGILMLGWLWRGAG